MRTHTFHHLGSVVDDLHDLLDDWTEDGTLRPALDRDGEIVLRLAVHEWVANLVQHAAFTQPETEIRLSIEVEPGGVYVEMEDTSCGFDLLGQIEAQSAILDAPAPSERGRGLLMLITCTESLDYRRASENRQRLSFRLENPGEAVFAGLFRIADLGEGDPGAYLHDVSAHISGDGHASALQPPAP